MLSRLSLRQKLIAVPAMGFLIVVIFITAMLGLVNRQESSMRQIVTQDLTSIARNTSLLSDLSRNHVSLQELLARYQQLDDSSSLQNIGLSRIYVIYQVRDNLLLEFQQQRELAGAGLNTALRALLDDLEGYAISAEATLEHASQSHSETERMVLLLNRNFSNTHRQFITFLELMGNTITKDTNTELRRLEQEVIAFTLGMSIVLFMLMVFSFRQTGDFSRSLHSMIKALNKLASGERRIGLRDRDYKTKELQQMSEAIDCFQRSLVALDITQSKVEETNQRLRQEITFKENAESELNNVLDALQLANDELENRVEERTQELAKINENLQQEVDFRREAEKQLQLFKMAVHNTSEAVIITDSDARILEVNPAYCQITGYSRQEVLGKNPNITRSDRHEPEFYQDMWANLNQNGEWSGEIWDRRKNGEVFPKWLSINAVNDGQSDYTYYVGVFMDISSLKQAEQQLERLAYYDPLTNLPNRVLFNDRLEQEIRTCSADHSRFGVLYIDLDRFKYVNDTLGHSVGDELLVEVGRRIKSCIREPDTVARISGDEFTVIVRSVHEAQDMEVVASKIIEQIERPVQIAEREIFVGASIGISLYPEHASGSELLKKYADMAMYRAKEAGRGRYQLFDANMTEMNLDRMALTGQLKQAIAQDEFILHYQPIVSIADSSIAAVEALIRWQPQEDKIVYPGDFIEHAEETGLIHDIGNWVLEAACEQAALWNKELEHPVAMAVNLSAIQFENPDLPAYIADVLQRTGLKPELLHVEITETTVMKQPEQTENLLREISALGVKISIDDFGAGYSSLSYLMRFTANKLKIDRAFTQQLTERRNDQIIPTAIINLGRSLHLETVAEGVETEFQLQMLKDKGCTYVQGYLLSRPVDTGATFELLKQHYLRLPGSPDGNPSATAVSE